jgi:sugar lactone lactonase YvrE
MWSVPVTGGEPTLVLRDAAFGQYFPDGKTIAFVDSPGGDSIQIADPDGSRRTLVHASTTDGIWWPEISPDGSNIAYQDGGSIYVVRVSTGESSKVADGDNATWLNDDTLIVSPRCAGVTRRPSREGTVVPREVTHRGWRASSTARTGIEQRHRSRGRRRST